MLPTCVRSQAFATGLLPCLSSSITLTFNCFEPLLIEIGLTFSIIERVAWLHCLVALNDLSCSATVMIGTEGIVPLPLEAMIITLNSNGECCDWPCGLMVKALVFGTKDSAFESRHGRNINLLLPSEPDKVHNFLRHT